MAGDGFGDALGRSLAGVTRLAVLGIGDDLDPRDRTGVLAAILVAELERPNVHVFLTGTMPENYTGALRTLKPSHVLLLDAADMAMPPGSLGLLHPEKVKGQRYSTHAMPLSLVMDYMEKELGAAVVLVGIQPDPGRPGDEGAPSKDLARGLRRLKSGVSKATRGLF